MPPPGPPHPNAVYAICLTQVFKYFLLKHLILYVFDIFHKEMITYYFGYIFLISYPNSQEQEKRFKVLRSTVKHKIPNLSCTPYSTKLEYLHTDTHTLLYRRYGRGQFPGKQTHTLLYRRYGRGQFPGKHSSFFSVFSLSYLPATLRANTKSILTEKALSSPVSSEFKIQVTECSIMIILHSCKLEFLGHFSS